MGSNTRRHKHSSSSDECDSSGKKRKYRSKGRVKHRSERRDKKLRYRHKKRSNSRRSRSHKRSSRTPPIDMPVDSTPGCSGSHLASDGHQSTSFNVHNNVDVAPNMSIMGGHTGSMQQGNIMAPLMMGGAWTHGFTANFNAIPEFDPKDNTQSIDNWIHKVNECSKIYCWDDRQTCHYALPKLAGLAKRWYQGLPTILFTWQEWVEKLRAAFPSAENYGDLLTKMLQLRCRVGQSLDTYYYEKMLLINKCDISGRKAVGCVVHGIDDKFIRMSVNACRFEEPEHLLSYLRTLSQNDGYYQIRPRVSGQMYTRDIKQNLFQSTAITPDSTKSNSIVCFGCNEIGHIRSRCPKAIMKCHICKRSGHIARDCRGRTLLPARPAENNESLFTPPVHTPSVNKITNIQSRIEDRDKYHKAVKVNGREMLAFIDLGSTCTIIKESAAQELFYNWDRSGKLPHLKGFGNSSVQPLGRCKGLICLDDIEAEVDMVIVPDEYMRNPIIIGQTFTELPNIVVHKTCKDLIFYEVSEPEVDEVTKIKLSSVRTITLEPSCTTPVEVQTNSSYSGCLYIPGGYCNDIKHKYLVLPGLYQVIEGKGFLLITNVTASQTELRKDTVIGRGLTFTESVGSYVGETMVTEVYKPLSLQQIKIGTVLNGGQTDKLVRLLDKYRECFAQTLAELGNTNLTEMVIKLNDDTPVNHNPYRMSIKEREQVSVIVEDLLRNGIIRPSSSSYASPIILVDKKNGQKRLCVDYRALNRKTLKDKYPLPRIEDKLDSLGGNHYFTSLDLASGYYQVPVAEQSKHLTAFVTPDGLYEYNRMPFGLANAPAVFQRVINTMIRNSKRVLAYMDDLLIPSRTIEQGLESLEEVFKMLRESKLTLNIEKCAFFQEQVDYLGYEISRNGVRPGSRKIEAVEKFPIPKNVHEVRQFVGLASYFRRFVENFSLIARPLTVLTKKNQPWQFGVEQMQAFQALKDKLVTRPILALYNPEASLEVHTDASKNGIGAILLQDGNKGLQPIAYYSRQTSPEEQKFHSYELETLAVITALNRFRVYLLGTPFKLITDCNAVRSTMTKKDLIPRVARWFIAMQEYDFIIEYRAGTKMSHVDALSRMPIDSDIPPTRDEIMVLTVDIDENWLQTVQHADPELQRIVEILKDKTVNDIIEIKNNYIVKNKWLYKIIKKDNEVQYVWVVPKSVRWQILKSNHDDLGHFGFDKTYERIRRVYWFKNMRRFIKKYCRACLHCAHNKVPSGPKEGMLHPIPKPDKPFDTLHADHCGPFPQSKRGNCYILAIIDAYSKFIYIKPVRNCKSKTTIAVFEEYFSLFGVPRRLITDRGTSFTSHNFGGFVKEKGIAHVLNAVATPRANGQIERYNRTIVDSVTASNHDRPEAEWDLAIPKVQWGLNNTNNKGTGKTPSEVLFGVGLTGGADGILNPVVSDALRIQDRDEIRRSVTSTVEKDQEKQKERFDKRRKDAKIYKVGDLVRVERDISSQSGQSKKLLPKCHGPYRISKVLGNDRYEVTDTPITKKEGKALYKNVFAVDKIHPWLVFSTDPMATDSDDNGD